MKRGFIALFALIVVSAFGFGSSAALAETRTLEMYYVNTGEKTSITFKKNGRYVASGLDKMNRFLRDWRRKEHIKMDPRLFDLVWEVRKAAGSRRAVHVVSAYRSPATNQMLRRTRGGQATKSQHMVGKAMDFYIPGVKSSTLRKIGLRKGWGGVGYYPRSGSPYVHLDTGRVRHWPRMSRKQLVSVFPNGRTLHVPTDGKPLKGYKQAQADDKRIRAGKSPTGSGGGNLLAGLFGGGKNETAVPAPRPVQTAVTPRAPTKAPVPNAVIPAGGVAGSGFDSDGAGAGGGAVPVATPEAAPEPIGPIELPLQVAAPRFNPQTPPTAITPDGTPTPEGPLSPDAPPPGDVLVARTAEEETPDDETFATALVETDIVPRQRPILDEPTPVDATLVASIPQPDFRPNGAGTAVVRDRFGLAPETVDLTGVAPAKFDRRPDLGEPVTSPRFDDRINLAHAFAPAASPTDRALAILKDLERTPLRSASSDRATALPPVAPTQVAIAPRSAPRPTQAPVQASQPARATATAGFSVAQPQFDLASAAEFTQDGSMALGTLNGATVMGWAITPLDPIKVQARGLRAPAYGQNALRLAPTVVIQKELGPVGGEPEWTSFDAPKPLKLAALD